MIDPNAVAFFFGVLAGIGMTFFGAYRFGYETARDKYRERRQ
jgi:hypothetical protein